MEYEITITKREDNSKFDPDRKNYSYNDNQEPYVYRDCLKTVVTEAQFEAIRKAVLEKF